jgi:hypothetical protein
MAITEASKKSPSRLTVIASQVYVSRKVAERPTRQYLLHVADQADISGINRQASFS